MPQKAEDKPQNDTPDAVTIKATSAASRCSVSGERRHLRTWFLVLW